MYLEIAKQISLLRIAEGKGHTPEQADNANEQEPQMNGNDAEVDDLDGNEDAPTKSYNQHFSRSKSNIPIAQQSWHICLDTV